MSASNQTIVIKKVKKVVHAHHGGAWKIAYADFVTAMMAFFLLLWLISMTSPEQKQGLADYFAPPHVSTTTSGSGGIMGGTAINDIGAQMAGTTSDQAMRPQIEGSASMDAAAGDRSDLRGTYEDSVKASQVDLDSRYDQVFHAAAVSIRQAWQAMPEITEIADNLLVEETPEGLSIQIADQEGRRMFPEGSKYPFEETRRAIAAIAPILQKLPNQVTITGHTAAGGLYTTPGYGSWELSSDRANAVRAILGEFGLRDDHIRSVAGVSTADPFFPNDPYLAANERVKILVLHEAPPVPSDLRP